MSKTKFFHRSTVRLALVYIIIFSLSVAGLLGFIYWSTAAYMLKQNDITIALEIRDLEEHYQSKGLIGLSKIIKKRLSNKPTGSSIYLLANSQNIPLIGNLKKWPDVKIDQDGWLNLNIKVMEQNTHRIHKVRARIFTLFGGFKLLVGRDIHLLHQTEKVISQSLIWGLLSTLLVAGIGGGIVSRNMLRRIEEINQTCQEIMSGDLSKRIPTLKNNDEFDDLANNLNMMLERIETLIKDVHHLSDNIAHDLRTPLTRLKHHLDSLQSELSSQEKRDLQEQAISEADNLLKTFNALLHVASIESATIRDEFNDVSIAQVLNDVIELYEPLIEEKQQTFHMDIDSTIVIKGNRELLSQAFANLVDNAIKYTPEKGEIKIHSFKDQNGLIAIEIRDTGTGIPEKDKDKVFQRFYRADKSRFSKGNGLGLSLVKAVFNLHQIKISLHNKEPGLSIICLLEPSENNNLPLLLG